MEYGWFPAIGDYQRLFALPSVIIGDPEISLPYVMHCGFAILVIRSTFPVLPLRNPARPRDYSLLADRSVNRIIDHKAHQGNEPACEWTF